MEFGGPKTAILSEQLAEVDATRRAHVAALERLRASVPEVATLDVVMAALRATSDAVAVQESLALSAQVDGGATERQIVDASVRAGVSRAGARATSRRAHAAAANPDLLGAGLSTDQLDVIANAASKTDGAAATDLELIERVASTTPDQGRKVAQQYVIDRMDMHDLERAHARSRTRRGWHRWITRDGDHAITGKGDKVTMDRIWRAGTRQANNEYNADGGRDTPADKHRRTWDQRLFDAFETLICNDNAATGGSAKPTMVVTTTLDRLLNLTDTPAEILGDGPIPDTVFTELAARSHIIGQIFNANGQILHHGHAVRTATVAQWLACVVRDRGCVLCGADPDKCQIHHLIPRNSKLRGPTDIDQLAMVCTEEHTYIHSQELTLERLDDGTWKTRPATPDEIAPKRSRSDANHHQTKRNRTKRRPEPSD